MRVWVCRCTAFVENSVQKALGFGRWQAVAMSQWTCFQPENGVRKSGNGDL